MCLIVASHTGVTPSEDLLRRAADDNPHGWGLAYVAPNGKIKATKGWTAERMLSAVKENVRDKQPYVLHFRWATHGGKDQNNIHPFRVGRETFMAHNGVLDVKLDIDSRMSDTWHFARILEKSGFDPSWPTNEDWVKEVGKSIGANRLAFLSRSGLSLVNETHGLWHSEGFWLSNENSTYGPRWEAQACSRRWSSHYGYASWSSTPKQEKARVTVGWTDKLAAPDDDHVGMQNYYCDSCLSRGHSALYTYTCESGTNQWLCEDCLWYYEQVDNTSKVVSMPNDGPT